MARRRAHHGGRAAGLAHLTLGRTPVVAAAIAVLVAAPFVVIGLGIAPFDDPGEGMHAEIARELAVARDPFALTLSGARYVDKPPLLYTLTATIFAVAGPSELTARLVPALSALVAIGATAWLGSRLLGAPGGWLAGIALTTSIGFFAYSRYVRPETLLVAALATGFTLTLTGLIDGRRGAVAAGVIAFGLAGLAKDSMAAIAPPAAIGLGLVLVGKSRPVTRWLPPAAGVIAIALAAGWWSLAETETPGFTWYTIVDNHLLNLLRARHFPDADVPLPATAYAVVAMLGAAPWSFVAMITIVRLARARAWRDERELPWIVLALWACAVFVITILAPFRLPHYGVPAYFAIALLAVRAWTETRGVGLTAAHAIGFAMAGIVSLAVAVTDGSLFVRHVLGVTDVATRKMSEAGQAGALPPWPTFQSLFGVTASIFLAGAVALGLVMFWQWRTGTPVAAERHSRTNRPALAVVVVALTMLAVLPVAANALAEVATHRSVRSIAEDVARRATPTDVLVHEGPLEDSGALEWYARRRPLIVDGRRSVLGFAATLEGAREIFIEPRDLVRLWATRRVWLVTTRHPQRSVARALPGAQVIAASGGRWLYGNAGVVRISLSVVNSYPSRRSPSIIAGSAP